MSNAASEGGEVTGGEDSDHEPEIIPDMALAQAAFRVLALKSSGGCIENETLALINKCKQMVRVISVLMVLGILELHGVFMM